MNLDSCSICHDKLKKPIGKPESCDHSFCYQCLKSWAEYRHECPLDRLPFDYILLHDKTNGPVTERVPAPPTSRGFEEENDLACHICGLANDEANLLICDQCDLGFHTRCLPEPLSAVPEGRWFCPACVEERIANNYSDTEAVEESASWMPNSDEELSVDSTLSEGIDEASFARLTQAAVRRHRGLRALHDTIAGLASRYIRHAGGRRTSRRTRNSTNLTARIEITSTNSAPQNQPQRRRILVLDISSGDDENDNHPDNTTPIYVPSDPEDSDTTTSTYTRLQATVVNDDSSPHDQQPSPSYSSSRRGRRLQELHRHRQLSSSSSENSCLDQHHQVPDQSYMPSQSPDLNDATSRFSSSVSADDEPSPPVRKRMRLWNPSSSSSSSSEEEEESDQYPPPSSSNGDESPPCPIQRLSSPPPPPSPHWNQLRGVRRLSSLQSSSPSQRLPTPSSSSSCDNEHQQQEPIRTRLSRLRGVPPPIHQRLSSPPSQSRKHLRSPTSSDDEEPSEPRSRRTRYQNRQPISPSSSSDENEPSEPRRRRRPRRRNSPHPTLQSRRSISSELPVHPEDNHADDDVFVRRSRRSNVNRRDVTPEATESFAPSPDSSPTNVRRLRSSSRRQQHAQQPSVATSHVRSSRRSSAGYRVIVDDPESSGQPSHSTFLQTILPIIYQAVKRMKRPFLERPIEGTLAEDVWLGQCDWPLARFRQVEEIASYVLNIAISKHMVGADDYTTIITRVLTKLIKKPFNRITDELAARLTEEYINHFNRLATSNGC